MWILLTPPGVEVDVRTSSAIAEPILVTAEQVLAVGAAAAEMKMAGLPVDVGALLTALCRPARDPAQLELPGVSAGSGGASLRLSPDEQAHQPTFTTAPEDRRMWLCACGKTYTGATGAETALQAHRATCAVHAATGIPADRRVDQ